MTRMSGGHYLVRGSYIGRRSLLWAVIGFAFGGVLVLRAVIAWDWWRYSTPPETRLMLADRMRLDVVPKGLKPGSPAKMALRLPERKKGRIKE